MTPKTEDEISAIREDFKAKSIKNKELVIYLDEDDLEKTATIFIKKDIGRSIRNLTNKLIIEGKPDKAVEAFLTNMYLGGDDLKIVFENDYAFACVDPMVVRLLNVHQGTIKKN